MPHKAACKLIRELADRSGIPPHPEIDDREAFLTAVEGDQFTELATAVSLHIQGLRGELSKTSELIQSSIGRYHRFITVHLPAEDLEASS